MKAITYTRYGSPDVLKLTDVEKPTPKDNEVLVRIHATTATAAHSMMRQGVPRYGRLFLGLTGPKNPIPGTDLAGVVEAVGSAVTRFEPGDRVFGATDLGGGCYAEYVCVPEDEPLEAMPANAAFAEAAAMLDGGATALHFLRDLGQIRPGDKVLVNGASGGVGTAAVQLAVYFGAEVTGVCSTRNVELVRSLGAEQVIDYTAEDFTRNHAAYDIIFDTVGKRSFAECKAALKPGGRYLSPVLGLPLLLQMLWTAQIGDKKARFAAAGLRSSTEKKVDIAILKELMETGRFRTVIDRHYPLAETAEAHRYIDTGRKRGNIAIDVVDTGAETQHHHAAQRRQVPA